MTQLTEQEAVQRIESLRLEVIAKVNEMKNLADTHQLDFDLTLGYGMSASYYGNEEDRCEYSNEGWYTSSMGC